MIEDEVPYGFDVEGVGPVSLVTSPELLGRGGLSGLVGRRRGGREAGEGGGGGIHKEEKGGEGKKWSREEGRYTKSVM